MQTLATPSVDALPPSNSDTPTDEEPNDRSSPQAVFNRILRLVHHSSANLDTSELTDLLEIRICPQVLASLLSWFCTRSDSWPSHSGKALQALSEITAHPCPSSYFECSGNPPSAGISLPPISKWPSQSGWSFNCWLYLFPGNEKPVIYGFFTSDGLGYSLHLESETLVLTTTRQKEKGFKHQILMNLAERTWHMLTVVYVYNRWGRGEICVYLNGELRSRIESSWNIVSDQAFTRCSIGGHHAATKSNTFHGRLTNIMGFVTSLSPEQIYSIYNLGVDYQGQFRFEADCLREITEAQRRHVYSGSQLYTNILFAYTPSACDPPVLLNRGPKEVDAFAHSPHALMNAGVQAVTAVSIPSALHSLGGMQAIYPLFERIDLPVRAEDSHPLRTTSTSPPPYSEESSSNRSDASQNRMESVATDLLHLVLSLVRVSPLLARQLVQTRGLLLFAAALRNASPRHLTIELLSRLITAARMLTGLIRAVHVSGVESPRASRQSYVFQLVRHLHGYVLCNPDVWIRAPLEIQDQLYQFLTTEFLPDLVRFGCVHRTSTVLQFIYTLKHYFSLVDPRKRSGYELKTPDKSPLRPVKEVQKLRANLLVYLKQLVARQGTLLDAEMQALLNYLLSVEEDENLHDVLYLLITLLVDTPQAVGIPFVRNDALHVAFKRLSVHDESNRVYAIKLLGFHLHFSRLHKCDDLMDRYSLFELMIERLHAASPNLSVLTYNALFEVLTNCITPRPQSNPKCVLPPDTLIQQPQMLRVISELIFRSEVNAESTLVRQIFLQHLLSLCSQNAFNRRTVLQLSVWQDCLLRLTPLHPKTGLDAFTLATTMRLFRTLLFHAIRHEREGWRVWIDTLALLHMWLEKADPFNVSQSPGSNQTTPSVPSKVSSTVSSAEDVGVDLTEPVARRMIQSDLGPKANARGEPSDPDVAEHAPPPEPQGQHRVSSDSPSIGTNNKPADKPAADTSTSDIVKTVTQNSSRKSSVVRKPSIALSPSRQISRTLFLRDFRWSHLHQLLLDDLLCSIEEDMGMISSRTTDSQPGLLYPNRSDSKAAPDFPANSSNGSDNGPTGASRAFTMFEDPSNGTFAINLVHFLSDCADMLVSASGGLLPLLAAASTITGEIGTFETVEGLSMSDALCFTLRVAYLLDLCILHVDLHTIERQRSMPAGALIRQFARLYLTAAVRDTLESRFQALLPTSELAHQLKLFTDPNDGVRFVTCPSRVTEASTIQYGADPEQVCGITNNSDPTEVDITAQQPGSSTGSSTNAPVAIRSLAGSASRTESEQLARRLLCLQSLDVSASNQGRAGTRLGLCPQPWRFVHFLSADQLLLLWEWKQQYEAQIAHLPSDIQRLLYALRPTFDYPYVRDKTFARSVLQPLETPESLLQVRDLNRLQGVIFKSEEVPRVPEFLALSVAYFLSVLMVSKYRDHLEPGGGVTGGTFFAAQARPSSQLSRSGLPSEQQRQQDEPSSPPAHSSNHRGSPVRLASVTSDHEDDSSAPAPTDSVMPPESTTTDSDQVSGNSDKSPELSLSSPSGHSSASQPRPVDRLTADLNTSLASTAAFLRDLFGEFHAHFSKHLLGSQGQVLLNTGATTLRESQSVIELVMLLCSQEWQGSLQKNAGLAFIELINEGRVTSRATQEHIVRVTQEAIVLLSRLSADSVQRHAQFGQLAAQVASHKRADDRVCDGLIEAARRRDAMSATLLNSKVHRLINQVWRSRGIGVTLSTQLSHLTGEPSDDPSCSPPEFYRLDCWEDDSRRRRRFSPNPYGSTHPSAVLYDLKEQLASRKRMQELREQLDAAPSDGRLTCAIPLITNGHDSSAMLEPSAASVREDPSASRTSLTEDGRVPELEDFLAQFEDGIDLTLSSLATEDTLRFSVPCVMVSFGVGIHGTLTLYKSAFQFERDPSHPINRSLDKKVLVYIENTRSRWSFAEVQAIFSRRYLHRTLALEIFVTSRSSVFIAFDEVATVQRVVNALPAVGVGAKYGLARTRATTLTSPSQLFADSNMTARWQRREISNFDYLMYLNTIAGRTYNDMNQYPIFPWILTNYASPELDLNEPSNYRDLSKPIGALDPKRKAYFDERYASWEDDTQPPFHYGTHYSTAAFVLGYLLRLEPFTTLFLNLQGGKFDHPDRTFASIGRTWENCQRSTSDVKELIPEFFYLPEMFENPNRLNLGITEDGMDVGSVELPPWASTPEDFVRVHRQALESDLVSCQLHHWIDLIFGYKQRGPEAVAATNVFHHLTYDGSVDWSKLSDPVLIKAVEDQIQSFGQTPAQLLLSTPHPHRQSALHLNPMMFSPLREELCMVYKFYSNSPVVFLAPNTDPLTVPQPGVVTVTANRTLVLSRWNCAAADAAYQAALIHPSSQFGLMDAAPETVSAAASHDRNEDATVTGSPTRTQTDESAGTEKESKPKKKSLSQPVMNNQLAASLGDNNTTSIQRRESTTSKDPTVLYPLSPASAYSGPNAVQSAYMHSLGDDFDQELITCSNQFTSIADNRTLVACGYDDCSFRLYALDSGRLLQAVFGHFGTVTCIAHSESQSTDYCYLASGSRDCTVKLWIYNTRRLLILGNHAESASPLVTLIGHEAEVTAVNISSELGIVLSGSKGGTCLLHNTRGTLLRQLFTTVPNDTSLRAESDGSESLRVRNNQPGPVQFVAYHREGYLVTQQGPTLLTLYTLNGKVIHASDLRRLAATTAYRLTAVVFSRCGRYLLVAGTDGVVWVLRSHNLAPVHAFPRCDSTIQSLGLSKDQHYVLVGVETGSLVVFYIDFGRWHHEFQERYPT